MPNKMDAAALAECIRYAMRAIGRAQNGTAKGTPEYVAAADACLALRDALAECERAESTTQHKGE